MRTGLKRDDREQLEVMAGVSAFPDARQMRDAGLARDEGGAGRRRRGEDRMSEDVQAKPETAAPTASPAPGSALPPEELEAFGNELIAALKTVYDPEIPVDIYELGLIYKVDVADKRTSPST